MINKLDQITGERDRARARVEDLARQVIDREVLLSHIRAACIRDATSRTWTISDALLLANPGGEKAADFLGRKGG